MNKRNAIATIISCIIIGGGILAYIISAVINLFHFSGLIPLKTADGMINKGEFVEARLNVVEYVGNITNTYGFIPTGKEYYYIAVDENTDVAYFVRSSKSLKYKEGSVLIKGKVRTPDTIVVKSFKDNMEEVLNRGYRKSYLTDILYIDNTIGFQSVLRLIASLFLIGGIAGLVVNPNARNAQLNQLTGVTKLIVSISVTVIMIGLVIAMYTTTFMF